MKQAGKRTIFAVGLGLFSAVVVVAAQAWAGSPDPANANRYPYDPVCAWGRVADGRGMLVRCITQQEARGLASASHTSASRPPLEPGDAAIPSDAGDGAPMAKPEEKPRPLTVSVGPIKVDTGDLPEAVGKLSRPKQRYIECVQKHGGLTQSRGQVHVRFLVRGRGRAEGVSVKKRSGLSQEAARCVADVVDRRKVGTPDAPMVGATLIFEFAEQ